MSSPPIQPPTSATLPDELLNIGPACKDIPEGDDNLPAPSTVDELGSLTGAHRKFPESGSVPEDVPYQEASHDSPATDLYGLSRMEKKPADAITKLDVDLDARLDVFRSYACSGGPWFAASMVPRRTDWEVVRADRRTVALSYLGKPLTIWILGNMISMTTYIGEQTDHPCARLVMGWRTEADRIAVDNIRRIVHRDYLSVKAEPFRAVSLGGQAGREVLGNIYNATVAYEAKESMARLSATDLRPGDVLLAECWFVRKEVLGGWQTTFELTAISRIAAADGGPAVITPKTTPFPWRI